MYNLPSFYFFIDQSSDERLVAETEMLLIFHFRFPFNGVHVMRAGNPRLTNGIRCKQSMNRIEGLGNVGFFSLDCQEIRWHNFCPVRSQIKLGKLYDIC